MMTARPPLLPKVTELGSGDPSSVTFGNKGGLAVIMPGGRGQTVSGPGGGGPGRGAGRDRRHADRLAADRIALGPGADDHGADPVRVVQRVLSPAVPEPSRS